MADYKFKNRFGTGWVEVTTPLFDMKTRDWGALRPVLDHARCKMCGICYLICPTGCIGLAAGAFGIDLDYCKGCGLCGYECPAKAISMT